MGKRLELRKGQIKKLGSEAEKLENKNLSIECCKVRLVELIMDS